MTFKTEYPMIPPITANSLISPAPNILSTCSRISIPIGITVPINEFTSPSVPCVIPEYAIPAITPAKINRFGIRYVRTSNQTAVTNMQIPTT